MTDIPNNLRLPLKNAITQSLADVLDISDEDHVSRKLAKALRSGIFTQGPGSLRIGGADAKKHCCLGVFCEILPEGIGTWGESGGCDTFYVDEKLAKVPDIFRTGLGFIPDVILRTLPEDMRQKANISTRQYAILNDAKIPFTHIAFVLEKVGLYSLEHKMTRMIITSFQAGQENPKPIN